MISEVISNVNNKLMLTMSTESSILHNLTTQDLHRFVTDFPAGNVSDTHKCESGSLIGPLGLFVQGLLAFLAFTSLIVKRFCEPKHERRKWTIWFFDTSKQAIGATVIHFANVFLAGIFSGDPCTWYFISFLLDSTVGLLIIYIGLKTMQFIIIKKGWKSLRFGEYGSPPLCMAWLGQCMLYIIVMLIEKFLMTLLVLFKFWIKVRHFLMAWVYSPDLELVIVMFIVPLIVNALVFWVVDNFLKKDIQKSVSVDPSNDISAVKFYKTSDRIHYKPIDKGDEDAELLLLNESDNDSLPSTRLIT